MRNNFEVKSHVGLYHIIFDSNLINNNTIENLGSHFIIDKNVFNLLPEELINNLEKKEVVIIDAIEETKSYQGIEPIITSLLTQNLKRDSVLVAIGGGITQDITCFIATTFMRGIKWTFVPTTVLAQADSCIGSKSSINFGQYKNLLGSFTPPNKIYICDQFLNSLAEKDIQSGIGEIIKLYIINEEIFDSKNITRDNINEHIYNVLMIKKYFIEEDEFDKDIRQILNYGHCIGHGIESATDFGIPHGIAVAMGIDAVNNFAFLNNLINEECYHQYRSIILSIYKEYKDIPISVDRVFKAMKKDKKNTGSKINLILPVHNSIKKIGFENTESFWNDLRNSLLQLPFTFQS